MERKAQVKNLISYFNLFSYLATFILVACQSTAIGSEELDSEAWKSDKKGCSGERADMVSDFEAAKDEMLNMSENQIRSLLGAPDKVQLFERSQKFYIYYIERGNQCEEVSGTKEGRHYQIRFNSLNQVNEVSLALPTD